MKISRKSHKIDLNGGIAEASMTSIAAGIALNNLRPIIYALSLCYIKVFRTNKIGAAYHKASNNYRYRIACLIQN